MGLRRQAPPRARAHSSSIRAPRPAQTRARAPARGGPAGYRRPPPPRRDERAGSRPARPASTSAAALLVGERRHRELAEIAARVARRPAGARAAPPRRGSPPAGAQAGSSTPRLGGVDQTDRNTALSASPQCASSTRSRTSGRSRASARSDAERAEAAPPQLLRIDRGGGLCRRQLRRSAARAGAPGIVRERRPPGARERSRRAPPAACRIAPVSASITPSSILNGTASRSKQRPSATHTPCAEAAQEPPDQRGLADAALARDQHAHAAARARRRRARSSSSSPPRPRTAPSARWGRSRALAERRRAEQIEDVDPGGRRPAAGGAAPCTAPSSGGTRLASSARARLLRLLARHHLLGVASNGRRPERLVEHRADRVPVEGSPQRLVRGLLRGHVRRRPDRRAARSPRPGS